MPLVVVAVLCIGATIGLPLIAYLHRRAQPVIERRACVVAKRQDISGDLGMISVTTTYFVTFEFEAGDREEHELKYGQLLEGDVVVVATQGRTLSSLRRTNPLAQQARSGC